MNYKNLYSKAVTAHAMGESLVLEGGDTSVAVIPCGGLQLQILPLVPKGQGRVICEDDFEQFAVVKWEVHPNFRALMNTLGEQRG